MRNESYKSLISSSDSQPLPKNEPLCCMTLIWLLLNQHIIKNESQRIPDKCLETFSCLILFTIKWIKMSSWTSKNFEKWIYIKITVWIEVLIIKWIYVTYYVKKWIVIFLRLETQVKPNESNIFSPNLHFSIPKIKNHNYYISKNE